MIWALDLDGVLWRGELDIPGAADAVAEIRAGGDDVVFVTNNAGQPVSHYEERLASVGVDATGLVITSSMAAARLLTPAERVLVFGSPALAEVVAAAGAVVDDDSGAVDAVVAGWHRFDYDGLERAHRAIVAGARFIATNDDASYPLADGTSPGNGAMVAALQTSTGVRPTVAGKPNAPMVELLEERFGPSGIVVGDRPETDGLLARRLGWRFGLVLSGVTEAGTVTRPRAEITAPSLIELVRQWHRGAVPHQG